MARVKICGINTPEAFAAAQGADWVGFNFFPRSPRFVTPSQAAALAGGPIRVGLFVAPSDDELDATLAIAPLDILQLYVDPARAIEIRWRVARPVWRAVGVGSRADLPTDNEDIDGYVIEAKAPPDAALPGGNAQAFDWTLLEGWTAPKPWLLGGGLNAANLSRAVTQSRAPAVDVSSGVELSRGVKDPALIRAFIADARALTIS